jgi:myosin heavy subunit
LEYEDLRGLTSIHFMRIKELEEIEANLRGNLAYEKGEKEAKIKQLAYKLQELKEKEE